jgi:hypothetical protein
MLVMQVSRMKRDLTPEEQKAFSQALEQFYASPPSDLGVLSDHVSVDGTRSFTLLEVAEMARLHEINEPFSPFVAYEVFEVRPATGKAENEGRNE